MSRNLKCLLINPSCKHAPSWRSSNPAWFPTLTLPLLAALTPEDCEISIVDENIQDIDWDSKPDIVGITSIVANAGRAYELARIFRQRGSFVVMGGHHVSAMPDEALRYCDAVVIGEAEDTWPRCVRDYLVGRTRKIYSPRPKKDLAGIPIPRYDLLPCTQYALPYFPIEVSRGCPMRCTFCNVGAHFRRRFAARPIPEIIRDIEASGQKKIFFADDNLTGAGADYTRALFDAIKPLDIEWISECDIRLAHNQSLLYSAAESGCVSMYVGIESINQASLDSVNKGFNRVDEFPELIGRFHDAGITFIASVIFGLDEDDPDIFERTVEFLQANRVPVATFFILTPAPGSVLWEEMIQADRILHKDWSRYDDTHVVFKPKKMSPEQLVEGLWWAYERYYSKEYIEIRAEYFPKKGASLAQRFNELYRKGVSQGLHPLSS